MVKVLMKQRWQRTQWKNKSKKVKEVSKKGKETKRGEKKEQGRKEDDEREKNKEIIGEKRVKYGKSRRRCVSDLCLGPANLPYQPINI